jgi:hypothetical protein
LSVLLHVWLLLSSRPAFPELEARQAGAGMAGRLVMADLVQNVAPRAPSPGIAATSPLPASVSALAAASASASTSAATGETVPLTAAVPRSKAGLIAGSAAPNLPEIAKAEGTDDPNLYYSAHSLSRQPELVGERPESLEIPDGVQSGHLLVRLSIDRFGKVKAVSVLRSTLPHDIEGQVAMQFYQANYRPGEIDGKPVNGEMILFINLERT